jgi:hypothetical protein
MSTEPSRDRLPFEPRQKRQKPQKKAPAKNATPPKQAVAQNERQDRGSRESTRIPDVVSRRMVSRMVILCGVPTTLGLLTFFVSYLLVTKLGLELPNAAVVLVSMGFFGLGVLGLSYSVLSASWDEDKPGSFLGWREFVVNWQRMTSAWRSAGQKDS